MKKENHVAFIFHLQKHKIFCYYNIFTKQYTNDFFWETLKHLNILRTENYNGKFISKANIFVVKQKEEIA